MDVGFERPGIKVVFANEVMKICVITIQRKYFVFNR